MTAKQIDFKDGPYVFTIETTASITVNRDDDFFREVHGVIKAEWVGIDDDESDDEELPPELGTVQLYVVRVADLIVAIGDPWSYADGDSQEMGDLFSDLIRQDDFDGFDTPASIAYDILPEDISNLLLIHHLKIHPDLRNRGLGGMIVKSLLKQYDYCELIALKPFGVECEKIDPEDSSAIRQAKEKVLDAARKRLTLYYQTFGLRLISEDHMFFCPALANQPALRQARDIRRQVKEASEAATG